MAKKPPVAKVQKETTATTSNNTAEEVTTIPAATFDIQEQINAAFSNATAPVAVNEVSETAEVMDEAMLPYLDAYPNVDTFYRTTDGQVFLNDNLAVLHQRTLTGDNKFKTFKR